jgi:hypothetical protein
MARSAIVINLIILPPPFFCATATWLQNNKERIPKNGMTLFNDFIVASIRMCFFMGVVFLSLVCVPESFITRVSLFAPEPS